MRNKPAEAFQNRPDNPTIRHQCVAKWEINTGPALEMEGRLRSRIRHPHIRTKSCLYSGRESYFYSWGYFDNNVTFNFCREFVVSQLAAEFFACVAFFPTKFIIEIFSKVSWYDLYLLLILHLNESRWFQRNIFKVSFPLL